MMDSGEAPHTALLCFLLKRAESLTMAHQAGICRIGLKEHLQQTHFGGENHECPLDVP